MKKPIHIILLASLSILIFKTLVSLFPINSLFLVAGLALIPFLIYAIAGFLVARHSSLRIVVLAAMVIGLVDATISEAITWIIDPESLASLEFSALLLISSLISNIILAIAAALIGWFVELLVRKTQSTNSAVNGSKNVMRIVSMGIVWLLIVIMVMLVGFFIGLAVDQQEGLLGLVFGFFGLLIGIIVATFIARYQATKIWPDKEE